MDELDLKKQFKYLYNPSAKEVVVVDVPPLLFARFDGEIEPDCSPGTSPSFKAAISALYGISYTLKYLVKKRPENPINYPVMALEALWWTEDGTFDQAKPAGWRWTAQMLQPDLITPELWAEGLNQLRKKRDDPAIDKLRLESVTEGLSIQVMHIGPYNAEQASLEKMHSYQIAHGYRFRGPHHEIYIGDPMRADPSKLKTVLRHPVEREK